MEDAELDIWLDKYHITRWYFDQILQAVEDGNFKMDHHSKWCMKKECALCDSADPWVLWESDKDSLLNLVTPIQWTQTVALARRYLKIGRIRQQIPNYKKKGRY